MKKLLHFTILLTMITFSCKENKTGNTEQYNEKNHPSASSEYDNYRLIRGRNIRIREAPGLDSGIMGLLQGGNEVTILEETGNTIIINNAEGEWKKVKVLSGKFKGKTGWVFSAYILDQNLSPSRLIGRIYRSSDSVSEKLVKIQDVKNNFPEYMPDGDSLYSFDHLFNQYVEVLECWTKKIDSNDTPKSLNELKASLSEITENFDEKKAKSIFSCEFMWMNRCGGTDAMPSPINRKGLEMMKAFLADHKSEILPGDKDTDLCLKSNKGKKTCFYSSKKYDAYYISWVCSPE